MAKNEDFVVRYTNKDIMDKLDQMDNKLGMTIGLSKKAMWAAGTALTLALALLTLLLSHLSAITLLK